MRGIETVLHGLGSNATKSSVAVRNATPELAPPTLWQKPASLPRAAQVRSNEMVSRNQLVSHRPSVLPYAVPNGLPQGALGSLGDQARYGRLFCTEIDSVVDAIRAAAAEAARVRGAQATSNPNYIAALAFADRMDSFFSPVLLGDGCTNAVSTGKGHISALNAIISGGIFDSSGTTISQPNLQAPPTPTPSLMDTLGSLKTILIAGAVIAGVVLVAPVVYQAVAVFKRGR